MDSRSISLIVLAGGKSSRMGQEKSDLVYQGKSFLSIQVEKARQLHISDVIISGYRGCQKLDFPVIPDITAEQGPLGGLITCLNAIRNEWALVLSVDAPLVPASELEKLMDMAFSGTNPACIVSSGGRHQPLIGVYNRCLVPAMQEELTHGKGSVFAVLRRTGCGVYESSADPALFSNVNDMQSYQSLLNR